MTTIQKLREDLNLKEGEETLLIVDQLKSATITVPENSTLNLVTILTEPDNEHKKLQFQLTGKNATVRFFAMIIGKNHDSFSLETESLHKSTNTNAYYYVRSALFDKSRMNYKGNLIIPKPSQQTDSYLAHHTLMLSKDARTDSLPCLEIEADDVKAGHAATIGNVDEELLFYFESRGIEREMAKDMMINGFLQSDLTQIPEESLRKNISEILLERLKNHINIY